MLHLIPPPLHRLLYRLAHRARRKWLCWFKPELHGCAVILRDGEGRVLLVRHPYGADVWALPGGGMRKGEDPLLAAHREIGEELGCSIEQPKLLGLLEETFLGARNTVHVFSGRPGSPPTPDMREII